MNSAPLDVTADAARGSDGSIGCVVAGAPMRWVYVDVLADGRVRVYAEGADGRHFERVLPAPPPVEAD
jgi:hypothetical protein